MVRTLLVLAVLALAVGAILIRLRAGGLPVKTAVKMAALAAGFVVSVKMVLGGYLAIQADAEPPVIEVLGFYGSLGLAVFFGVTTLVLWRRGTSRPSSSSDAFVSTNGKGQT